MSNKNSLPIRAALDWGLACIQGQESRFYETDPASYEAIVRLFHHRQQVAQEVARVANAHFTDQTPRQHLDTACGTGIVTQELAQTAPDCSTFVGMDISAPSLQYAAETKDPRIQWREGSFTNLDRIEDQSVDVYTMVAAYRHIPERQRFFEEIRRVLSPRGLAIIPQCRPGDMSNRDLEEAIEISENLGLKSSVQKTNFKEVIPRLIVPRLLLLYNS